MVEMITRKLRPSPGSTWKRMNSRTRHCSKHPRPCPRIFQRLDSLKFKSVIRAWTAPSTCTSRSLALMNHAFAALSTNQAVRLRSRSGFLNRWIWDHRYKSGRLCCKHRMQVHTEALLPIVSCLSIDPVTIRNNAVSRSIRRWKIWPSLRLKAIKSWHMWRWSRSQWKSPLRRLRQDASFQSTAWSLSRSIGLIYFISRTKRAWIRIDFPRSWSNKDPANWARRPCDAAKTLKVLHRC